MRLATGSKRTSGDRCIRKNRVPRNSYGKVSTMKWRHPRRIIILLACAMTAPLASGQAPVANTSVAERTGQIEHQITSGAVIVGTVTAFNPGLRNVEPRPPIVVQSSADTEPVSYMLARKVLFEDKTAEHSPRDWSDRAHV